MEGEEPELAGVAWPHFSGFREGAGEGGLAKEVARGIPERKERTGEDSSQATSVEGCRAVSPGLAST